MNILVTGATGFVGRHLIPILLRTKEHKVICLTRNTAKSEILFGSEDNIVYIAVNDMHSIVRYEPKCVIHLAAYLTSKDDDESVHNLLDSNIAFGLKLLNTLRHCRKLELFVNLGTFAEYRLGPMEVDNAYIYSATKTAFKQLLKYYADSCGYKYIHVIPYTIYGGEDSQKKVIDYIKSSFNSPFPIEMSGGEQILDFIHIDDVVSFLDFLLKNATSIVSDETIDYHLGTGRGTSIRTLSNMLEQKYNKKCNIVWGALPYRERDVMYAVAPIAKLLQLGWKAELMIENNL